MVDLSIAMLNYQRVYNVLLILMVHRYIDIDIEC